MTICHCPVPGQCTRSRAEGDGRSDANQCCDMKADLATIGPEATLKARWCVGPSAQGDCRSPDDQATSSTAFEANLAAKAILDARTAWLVSGRGSELSRAGSRYRGIRFGRQRIGSLSRFTCAQSAPENAIFNQGGYISEADAVSDCAGCTPWARPRWLGRATIRGGEAEHQGLRIKDSRTNQGKMLSLLVEAWFFLMTVVASKSKRPEGSRPRRRCPGRRCRQSRRRRGRSCIGPWRP